MLPDGHRHLIVRPEELVTSVGIGRQASVLAQVEHPGVDADPVQVAGQFLGNVRFTSGWQPYHRNNMWTVYIVGPFA